MKTVKKLLVTIFIMVLVPALFPLRIAAQDGPSTVPAVAISIHKIGMNAQDMSADFTGKGYTGERITDISGFFGASAEEIERVPFHVFYELSDTDTSIPQANKDAAAGSLFDYDDPLLQGQGKEGYRYFRVTDPAGILSGSTALNYSVDLSGLGYQGQTIVGDYLILEEKVNIFTSSSSDQVLGQAKAVPMRISLPMENPDGSGYFDATNPLHLYPKNVLGELKVAMNIADNMDGAYEQFNSYVTPEMRKKLGASLDPVDSSSTGFIGILRGTVVPFEALVMIPQGIDPAYLDLKFTMYDLLPSNTVAEILPAEETGESVSLTASFVGVPGENVIKFNEQDLEKIRLQTQNRDIVIRITFEGKTGTDSLFAHLTDFVQPYSVTANIDVTPNSTGNPPLKFYIAQTPVTPTYYGRMLVKTDSKDHTKRLDGAQFVLEDTKRTGNTFIGIAEQDTTAYYAAMNAFIEAVNERDSLSSITNRSDAQNTRLIELEKNAETLRNALYTQWDALIHQYRYVATKEEAFAVVSGMGGLSGITGDEFSGLFLFTALPESDGYKLHELRAPYGYAKISETDGKVFTVGPNTAFQDGDIYVLPDATTGPFDGLRVDNIKITIPQTGGSGTMLFTAGGLGLMALALILLWKNRRKEEQ